MNKIFLLSAFVILSLSTKAQKILEDQSNSSEQNNSVTFTENKGQVADQHFNPRPDVLFSGETGGMVYHLRKDGISYQMTKIQSWREEYEYMDEEKIQVPDSISYYRTDINWIGINDEITIEKGDYKSDYYNYYSPVCPDGITRVLTYKSVTYKNIYNDIDLIWYDNNGALEYDFIVEPGADYKNIQWEVKGAEKLSISDKGELVITTPMGVIYEDAPIAYQGSDFIKTTWNLDENIVSFNIENFDPSKTLVIDPVVKLWFTFYGGTALDRAYDLKVDKSSNVYMIGKTTSINAIATSGAHQSSYLPFFQNDYITKFDSSGARIWATYYASNNIKRIPNTCTVDDSMNVYIAGLTNRTTGVATTGSHQDSIAIEGAYLAKFDSNGIRLWATYYGAYLNVGDGTIGLDCQVDKDNNVYMCGHTNSSTNIASSGSHQSTYGGARDAFLVKFNSQGVRQWGTYYGGSALEEGISCVVDDSGYVYMVGITWSTSGISTPSAYNTTGGGVFIVKFNSNGTRIWGTYFEGSKVSSCVVDDQFNLYFAGIIQIRNSFSTKGSHQSIHGGGTYDAYLVKMSGFGKKLWATYYGGNDEDYANDLASSGSSVFMTGQSLSLNAISTYNGYLAPKAMGYVVKFNTNGTRIWGSRFGPRGLHRLYAVDVDLDRGIYLAGQTFSTTGFSTPGSHQSTYGGGGVDAMLGKLKDCRFDSARISVEACFKYESPSGRHVWETSGTYYDTLINDQGCDSILTIQLKIDTVDTFVLSNGKTLNAVEDSATYQWVVCNGFFIIPGAIGQYYSATVNGSYAVIVSQNGCTDTSACYGVTGVGIEEEIMPSVEFFPNPTSGEFTIDLKKEYKDITITIRNANNQLISSQHFDAVDKISSNIEGVNGMYFVELLTAEGYSKYFKILKE